MMPLAILLGVLFHSYIDIVAWTVPYLIFVMLFFTFCRIEPRDLKFHKEMWQLLAIQILGSIIVFLPLNFINPTLARSAPVCVLCPVATAAPVVTGMLGGSIGRVASFSVLSNLSVALCAPAIFALVSPDSQLSFLEEFATIALKVCPMIVFPLLAAFLIRILTPRVHASLTKAAPITFYIWSVSLIIVVGRSVSFILASNDCHGSDCRHSVRHNVRNRKKHRTQTRRRHHRRPVAGPEEYHHGDMDGHDIS